MLDWHKDHCGLVAFGKLGEYSIIIRHNRAYLVRRNLKSTFDKIGTFAGRRAVLDAKLTANRWDRDR